MAEEGSSTEAITVIVDDSTDDPCTSTRQLERRVTFTDENDIKFMTPPMTPEPSSHSEGRGMHLLFGIIIKPNYAWLSLTVCTIAPSPLPCPWH